MQLKLLFSTIIVFITIASFGADVEVRLVALPSPSSSDTSEVLPLSIESLPMGQDYCIEIWTSDVGSADTGLTSVYVDENQAPCEVASIRSIDHVGIFTTFPSGGIISCGIVFDYVLVEHKILFLVSMVTLALRTKQSSKIINFVGTNHILFEEIV
jgi:hypothetical protein